MSYALVSAGTPSYVYNTSITPNMPPSFAAGNLLLLQAQAREGTPGVPTISGWTQLSTNSAQTTVALWGRIATGGDTAPTFTYGGDYASAWINAYSGNPSTLTGIVHAYNEKTNNSTNSVLFEYLTITQAGCLVLLGGSHNKSATTNSAVFNSLSGFTERSSLIVHNNAIAAVTNEQIQTTATSTNTVTQTLSVAETSSVPYCSFSIALLPGATVSGQTLTAAAGSFASTGEGVTFTPGFASNTMLANPGAFDLVGAPSSSDYQIFANPALVNMSGDAAQLASGGFAPTPKDPNQFGHWRHHRQKELAKLRRIEWALKKRRGEIHEEPPEPEHVPEPVAIPVGPRNATGMKEAKVNLAELLAAAMQAKPLPVPPTARVNETPGQKALREYEEMVTGLTRMVPAARDKVH